MINHQQLVEMIDAYGVDIQHWPYRDKEALKDYINATPVLNDALSKAVVEEQQLQKLFSLSEPQWSERAEQQLHARITQSITKPSEKRTAVLNRPLFFERIKAFLLPAFPSMVALLLLLVVGQSYLYQSQESLYKPAFSSAELTEWLVLEGLSDEQEAFVDQGLEPWLPQELEEMETGELAELMYYL